MEDEKVFFYKGEDYKIKTSEYDNLGIKIVLENKYPKGVIVESIIDKDEKQYFELSYQKMYGKKDE